MPASKTHKNKTHKPGSRYNSKHGHNKHTKRQKRGQLFGDDNPDTTIHGYGFSNAKIAMKTIQDLKYRDIDYQFQVVNTMIHRAKSVITRMKNNTRDIKEAIAVYQKWLDNYKSNNLGKSQSRPYLTPDQVDQLEFLAQYYGISEKARGIHKPTKSDKGFKVIWETSVQNGGAGGDKKQLRNMPIKKSIPNGQTWDKHRNQYLARRLSMVKNADTDLYYTSGRDSGLPTKLHVNMMMWAYSPDVTTVLKNIKKYEEIITKNNGKKQ